MAPGNLCEFHAFGGSWAPVPSCQLLGSNFLLYQPLNLCVSKLRVISWMKSNPLVGIIFKHYLFSLSLETLEASFRNWNRLLSDLYPGQFFFYEQLQIHVHYQLQWICDDGIYSAVQNVSYVILHVPPQPMCWVPVQLLCLRTDILINMTWYFIFWSKSIVGFFVGLPFVYDLPNFRASESPPSNIPTDLMVTPYRPDIVMHSKATSYSILFCFRVLTCSRSMISTV